MAKRPGWQEPDQLTEESEQARLDIEKTRAQMGETLDSIGDRLSPERLKTEAIDTADQLKTAAVQAARAATQEVISGVREATWGAYDNARSRINQTKSEIEGAGMSVIRTLKYNPIPAAMVGMGVYWLYQSMHSEKPRMGLEDQPRGKTERAGASVGRVKDSLAEVAREKVQGLRQAAGEQMEHYGEALHDGGERAADEFQQLLRTSPLAVAGVAAAIGLAFGMMLPESEVENRTMGPARDQIVGEAQDKVTEVVSDLTDKAVDLKDKAVEAAGALGDAAKDQIQQAKGAQ